MSLKLFNTLGRKKEPFQPLQDHKVRMYTCGPTVYNYIHIGNLRTFLWEDVLRRYLQFLGYQVTQVMNITDVDDKTIRDSRAQGKTLREFTDYYTQAFMEDIQTVRIKPADVYPRATEHIPQMVELIQRLEARGHTYRSEGAIYFKIASFPEYGKLSGINLSLIKPGARVDRDEYEKEDVRDFALWKAPKEGEPIWDTPIGKGRPGWHIECSAMSMHYLGESFDIHTGAVDNIFPHHENEIAQSEGATGKPFVNLWLHGEHLIVEGEKMAKSKGNFYTLRDLLKAGHDPLAIRYLLISVPYRKKLNFTFDALEGAGKAVERLDILIRRVNEVIQSQGTGEAPVLERVKQLKEAFRQAMDDDLNTAEALGALFRFVKDVNGWLEEGQVKAEDGGLILSTLQELNQILDILPPQEDSLSEEILSWIQQREKARKQKDYRKADEIRAKLQALGIIVEDTPQGTRWRKKLG